MATETSVLTGYRDHWARRFPPSNYPSANATAFRSMNTTDITDTTPQLIKAAPAAGRRLYIKQILISNKTSAERPLLTIQDGTGGSPDKLAAFTVTTLHNFTFDPPLKLEAAKPIYGVAHAALGDVVVTVFGWEDDA